MKSPRLLFFFGLLLITVGPLPAADTWLTDFADAKATAMKEHKKLLLDFTDSDWCRFCIKLENEVLSKDEFATFAKDYVLVRLDYPQKKALPAAEKAQNAALMTQFKIEGYPTLIVADARGNELSRAVGYEPGSGPAAYLAQFKP